jgi:hypothetical protein
MDNGSGRRKILFSVLQRYTVYSELSMKEESGMDNIKEHRQSKFCI